MLYFGILTMNVSVTFWIGEPLIGGISLFLSLILLVFYLLSMLHPTRRATPQTRSDHLLELGPGWALEAYRN